MSCSIIPDPCLIYLCPCKFSVLLMSIKNYVVWVYIIVVNCYKHIYGYKRFVILYFYKQFVCVSCPWMPGLPLFLSVLAPVALCACSCSSSVCLFVSVDDVVKRPLWSHLYPHTHVLLYVQIVCMCVSCGLDASLALAPFYVCPCCFLCLTLLLCYVPLC